LVRELLVGDNPFIGVSHLGQEKAIEEMKEVSQDIKLRVLEAALRSGATGFTFSTHKDNLELLKYVGMHQPEILRSLNFYILVPYAQSYVRRANLAGTPNLVSEATWRMLRAPDTLIDVIRTVLRRDPKHAIGAFLETELSPFLSLLPRDRIKAVLLHEVLSDLILAFRLTDLLRFLDRYLKDRIGVTLGLETRNFGHLYDYMSTIEYWPQYLMTPLNPLGYQMAPGKDAVEKSIRLSDGRTKTIAMNILASGASTLQDSITYLEAFKTFLYAVTTASTKPTRISSNLVRISARLL
jgi:hypothetical protein